MQVARSAFASGKIAPRLCVSRSVAVRPMAADKAADIKTTVKDNKVVVYSKTYCPYCTSAKQLFQKLKVDAKVIELDQIAEGDQWQSTLQSITGQRTVPQVFIGGSFVGGCDDTMAAYQSGDLKSMLSGVGISIA